MSDVACSHKNLTPKFEVPFDAKSNEKTPFGSVRQCDDCGLNLVAPMPGPEQIEAHYQLPAYYTHGESHIPAVEPTFLNRAIVHLVWRTDRGRVFDPQDEKAISPDARRALDIGCGSGDLLSKMKELGLDTFGIDPDAISRAEAAKRGHTVFAGTAEALPTEVSERTFDVVTMTHVLEHCLDPVEALSNAHSLLSDDGLFYCEVPNSGSIYFETYGQISEMLDVPRHLYFFKKRDLEKLAGKAGLKITGWRYSGLTRHFGAGWKNWENSIFDRLVEHGVQPVCSPRSTLGDLKLLASAIFQDPERRYDSIGFLARRGE